MTSVKETLHPEVRHLWWMTLVVQATLGFTNGLYLYTYGPYFYERFGGKINPETAMIMTTVLLGIRQALVALLEVPTGALADAIGRVHVVNLSWIVRILFFLSLAVMWLCNSIPAAFAWGVIASMMFALQYALFNGAFAAWCAETLREKSPQVTYGWLSSRFYSYHSLAAGVGGAIAVVFFVKGVAFIGFVIAAFLTFCGMGYSMNRMTEVKSLHFLQSHRVQLSTVTKRIGEIIGRAAQVCSRTPVLFWIVFAFGNYMFLLNVVMYLWPVYFKAKFGLSTTLARDWILIVLAAELLRTIGARVLVWLNGRWSRSGGASAHIHGFRRIFVGAALLSACSILALSWNTAYNAINGYLFPAAVLIVILSFGIIGPCFETLVNAYIPRGEEQERTTILSAGSMIRSLLILILAVPSGGTTGETSPISWALPAAFLLLSTILANHFMRKTAQEKTAAAPLTVVTTEKGMG